MQKTATFGYGMTTLPAARTLRDFFMFLVRNNGMVVAQQQVPYGTPSIMLEVPNGTGWKIQVVNYDDLGQPIGPTVESAPFDVEIPVSIVVSVAVS